jgi:Caspase domain
LLGLAVLCGLVTCGCFHARLTRAKELQSVRVLLEPDVELTSRSSEDDCRAHEQAEKRALLDSLRTGLSTIGFQVVGARSEAHEAVAHVAESCTSATSGETWRRVTVVLDPGGEATSDSTYGALSELVKEAQVLALGRGRTEAPTRSQARSGPVLSARAPAPSTRGAPNPPLVSASPQRGAFAVVIGVESYSHIPALPGARDHAQDFADLARHTLGVPSDHIKVALDAEATKATIQSLVTWARDSAPLDGRIYFYFSGHGAPDPATGARYILPSDGDPKLLTDAALSESAVLAELSSGKAKDVLAILDSCFSGGSVLPPGAQPLTRLPDTDAPGRVAVLTGASGPEASGPSANASAGAFTKYLVQGLGTGAADIDGDGQITLQELYQWVSPRVAREAARSHRDQHPGVFLGTALGAASNFVVEWGLPSK